MILWPPKWHLFVIAKYLSFTEYLFTVEACSFYEQQIVLVHQPMQGGWPWGEDDMSQKESFLCLSLESKWRKQMMWNLELGCYIDTSIEIQNRKYVSIKEKSFLWLTLFKMNVCFSAKSENLKGWQVLLKFQILEPQSIRENVMCLSDQLNEYWNGMENRENWSQMQNTNDKLVWNFG